MLCNHVTIKMTVVFTPVTDSTFRVSLETTKATGFDDLGVVDFDRTGKWTWVFSKASSPHEGLRFGQGSSALEIEVGAAIDQFGEERAATKVRR